MKIRAENKVLDTFSFSSLTDIVMLLLIFFLLSSSFIIQPGIKVKLPVSDTAESTNEKNITITPLHWLRQKMPILLMSGSGMLKISDQKKKKLPGVILMNLWQCVFANGHLKQMKVLATRILKTLFQRSVEEIVRSFTFLRHFIISLSVNCSAPNILT